MMKKTTVSALLKELLARSHRALFGHMVRSGMTLCAVDGVDGEQQTEVEAVDEQLDDSTPQAGIEGEVADDADDDEHVVVTIGEEAPPEDEEEADAPGLVNKLRKLTREKDRELRELRAKVAAPAASAPAAVVNVEKPTLAGCEYDEEAFEQKLTNWTKQQAKVEAERQAQADREKAANDAWAATLANHSKARAALKVPDYEEAESVIAGLFSQTQRGIIVSGADNSALVEYALGKNPARAKEFASIKDPVKFAFAIAKLEPQLKVTARKTPPPPEKIVRGSAPVRAGSVDAQLAKLEAEAERTGDRTKVQAFKREQKRVAAAA